MKITEYIRNIVTGNFTFTGLKTFTDGIKTQGEYLTPYGKNYIINGNFDVWQRGTSFTGLTNGSYSADRWVVYDAIGDINYNVIRNEGVFTGGYGAEYTWNSGNGERHVNQFIENVTRFKVSSNVTVSFEAYTNSTPYSIDVGIQAVRGVWASATAVVSSPITLTNTKTKYSVTLSVPNWSSIGIDWAHLEDTKLALRFDFAADTNGKNFIIGNVQLEEGTVATKWSPYNGEFGGEVQACQRYFWKGYADDVSANRYGAAGGVYYLIGTKSLPTRMRVAPSVSRTVVGTYVNCTFTDIQASKDSFNVRGAVTANGAYRVNGEIYSASAEL